MSVIKSVQVIQVIEISFKKGSGTEKDPNRIVTQYWNQNGEMIAENDPTRGNYCPDNF